MEADRAYLIVIVLLVALVLVLPVRASPLEEPAPSSGEDVVIIAGAAESEARPAAPPPITEGEIPGAIDWSAWEWSYEAEQIPLGFSGGGGTIGGPDDELGVLLEIRDMLELFLALVVFGISYMIVRFIIDVSLKRFTRYTGL